MPFPDDSQKSRDELLDEIRRMRAELKRLLPLTETTLPCQEQMPADCPREDFTRRVLNSLFAFVGLLDPEGRMVDVNEAPLRAANLTRDDVLGRQFWDCYWWSYSAAVQEQLRDACRRTNDGETVRYDVLVRVADDQRMWIDFQIAPLRDADGRITHLIPSALDISDRRRVEDALRQSEAELAAVINGLPVGVRVTDTTGRTVAMNKVALRLYGMDNLQQMPPNLEQLAARYQMHDLQGHVLPLQQWPTARALRGDYYSDLELSLRALPDGRPRIISYTVVPVRDALSRVEHLVFMMQDITERHWAQQALRDSERKFRALADNIPQLAWMTDDSGYIFWYNQRWFDYTGQTMEQMQGWGWQQLHHPDHVDQVVRKFKQHLSSGQAWEDTFPLRGKDGRYRWFLSRAFPIIDPDGKVVRWFGTNTDITEQKLAEESLQRVRAELEQRVEQRTAELRHRARQLGRLTSQLTQAEQRERRRLAQVLHDHLQQLLVAAMMNVDVLVRRVEPSHHAAMHQVQSLINEAIAASRSLTVDLSPPILHEGGLTAGLEWLSRWMKSKHNLDVSLRVQPDVSVDREDMRVLLFQAVRELLFNVIKHAHVSQATVEVSRHGEDRLRVTVSDSGRGMDPDSVFRENGGSSGFGLFSIRERLALLGGQFLLEATAGGGTSITLLAPLRAESNGDVPDDLTPQTLQAQAPATPPLPRGEGPSRIRILLADDHAVMRQGLSSLLAEEHDIQIVGEAANGGEAVDQARRLQPDIVLMDFSMPQLNGVDATRRLRSEQPHIQVIGLSMYEEPDRAAAMTEAGAAAYLAKSGRSDVLLATIRRVVANRRASAS